MCQRVAVGCVNMSQLDVEMKQISEQSQVCAVPTMLTHFQKGGNTANEHQSSKAPQRLIKSQLRVSKPPDSCL